jgi:hypothetical protein
MRAQKPTEAAAVQAAAQPAQPAKTPPQTLGGENVRGEVAGCPTGLTDPEQAQAAQQPGGGGAPGTGEEPVVPFSPGEGVTEEQAERSEK